MELIRNVDFLNLTFKCDLDNGGNNLVLGSAYRLIMVIIFANLFKKVFNSLSYGADTKCETFLYLTVKCNLDLDGSDLVLRSARHLKMMIICVKVV